MLAAALGKREAAGPGGLSPQRGRVLAGVPEVGGVLPVFIVPGHVVVDGLRLLDALQYALVLLRDSHELHLALVAVQARWPAPRAAPAEGGCLHDARHLLEEHPVLAVDLVVALLQELLPLEVVPQVIEVHDGRLRGVHHGPDRLDALFVLLVVPLADAVHTCLVRDRDSPMHGARKRQRIGFHCPLPLHFVPRGRWMSGGGRQKAARADAP
mmetsp:Transcript_12672/g.35882  ORF Transcript_12672/g.35882 Transcript_12672/m.35882 type:complete len:212 (+) Transcript_12672:515-1150(+)